MKTNRTTRSILRLALWIAMMPLPVAAQTSEQAQIEKGRVTVAQVCVGCHGGIMRMLEVRKRSEDAWRDTVHSMIGRGAQIFPDEIEPLVSYLVASAGRGRPQAASPVPGAGASRSAAAATTSQGVDASVILARRCQQCHDIERATTRPASDGWDAVIDRMVTLGATVTPAERQALIRYLDGLQP